MGSGVSKQADLYEKVVLYPLKNETFNSCSLLEKLLDEVQAGYSCANMSSEKGLLDHLSDEAREQGFPGIVRLLPNTPWE